jgi:hypothetical protein
LLTFLQTAEATSLNGGEMYKDILPVLTADETVAFGVVKPLHCSFFHCFYLLEIKLLRRIACRKGDAV